MFLESSRFKNYYSNFEIFLSNLLWCFNFSQLTGDQNITGHFTFHGLVHFRDEFNPRLINGIDPNRFIPLNTKSTIVGRTTFEKKNEFFLISKQSIIQYESVNFPSYEIVHPFRQFRIRETSDSQQKSEAVGLFKWHRCESMGSCGSDDRKFSAAIYFWKLDRSWQRLFPKRSLRERDFKRDERHGGIEYLSQETLGNGRHVGREKCKWNLFWLDWEWNFQRKIFSFQANLDVVCEDLAELKRYAENQIYQFNAFDYLQMIEFDNGSIASVHYFETNDTDHLILSCHDCQMHAYAFIEERFELVGDMPNFGVVEEWATFERGQALYFLTSGPKSCGRNPVNVWRLRDNEFKVNL